METKKLIRNNILKQRNDLSLQSQILYSNQIQTSLFQLPAYIDSNIVLLYADFNGEVKTDHIFIHSKNLHKEIYYPKVFGETMDFYHVDDLSQLFIGYQSIREPNPSNYELISDIKNQEHKQEQCNILLILPGVAFDNQKHRIGYGKGFYDKYIAFMIEKLKDRKDINLTTVALCYECQKVKVIQTEQFDYVPDFLITENEIIK